MPNFHVGRNRKCGFLLYWLRVSWCIVLLKTQISLLIKQPMLANSPNREIIKVDPYEENARLPMRFEPTTVTITVQCYTTWAIANVDKSSGVLPFDHRWRRQRRSRGSAGRSSSASPGQASSLGRTCGWGWNKSKVDVSQPPRFELLTLSFADKRLQECLWSRSQQKTFLLKLEWVALSHILKAKLN